MPVKKSSSPLVPVEVVQQRILMIRGQRVILASDLAQMYGVPVKRLNEQVRRNKNRFPADFMFQLTRAELGNLKSQIATSSWGGARRALPYAFTEHGAIMAATVLSSPPGSQRQFVRGPRLCEAARISFDQPAACR